MGKTRTPEFKEKVVKEYLNGARMTDVTTKYYIHKSQNKVWTKKWREVGCFTVWEGRWKKKLKEIVITPQFRFVFLNHSRFWLQV